MLHAGKELVLGFVLVDGWKSVFVVVLVRVLTEGLESVPVKDEAMRVVEAVTIVMVKWSAASVGTLVLLADVEVVLDDVSVDGRKSVFAAVVTRLSAGKQENVYLFENNVR